MTEKGLSKATFLEMAEVAGVETSDKEYLDLLYEQAKGALQLASILDEPDLAGVEPASVYSTGYGLPGTDQEGG